MNLPFFVRLQSGLLLNLSQLSVIHPRQPNGSIRVQTQGSPLIVISPVTDEDESNIRVAVAMLQEWLIQQLDLRNLSSEGIVDHGGTITMPSVPAPTPRTAKKKRRRKKVTRRQVTA